MPRPARTWSPPPAVPLLHTACWEARTPAHPRPHHSHTVAHLHTGPHSGSHTGSLPHSGALAHSWAHSHARALSRTPLHSRYACVAARISTHWCIRTATPRTPGPHSQPHTRGHSRWGQHSHSPRQELPGSSHPPSSARNRQQHSPPLPLAARPNSPGRDRLQGGILPPLVLEGGYPAVRTGSPHARRALPHCPSLSVCVCVCVCARVFLFLYPV